MYIRSLFEANKDVRDPRQQKVSAASHCIEQLVFIELTVKRTGTASRDREAPRDMETP